ncbi:gp53-like domain-containing protein [Atlantibacter hermannii]|uniref:gp53-like domain-containing protein n=1 Tax=Atlantibacter hermannii TaxID=565 RepID=UPI002FFA000B
MAETFFWYGQHDQKWQANPANLGLKEIALAGVMSAVLSDGGRLTLPVIINGTRRELLIQWGQMPCSNLATTTTAFPVPFPSACLKVVGWGYQVAGSIQAYAVLNGFNRNSFTWNAFYAAAGSAPSLATTAAVNIHYIAIGY